MSIYWEERPYSYPATLCSHSLRVVSTPPWPAITRCTLCPGPAMAWMRDFWDTEQCPRNPVSLPLGSWFLCVSFSVLRKRWPLRSLTKSKLLCYNVRKQSGHRIWYGSHSFLRNPSPWGLGWARKVTDAGGGRY